MASVYNNLYLDARKQFKNAGVESAQLEAREIVCFAAGKSREAFYRDRMLYAPDQVEEKVHELVRRRLAGEPVAYLIGEWEFYGLPFTVTSDVLIPRMDTEVLAEQAILLARAAGERCRVLDLCAGSGCVGLAVAANVPGARAVLCDVSEGALRLCRENARRNELQGRVTCLQADARLRPPAELGEFQVIACNPPYIPTGDLAGLDPTVRDYEPRLALDGGADGLDFYRAIAQNWREALHPGGTLLFEVGIGQAGDVEWILSRNGYRQVRSFPDTQQIPRVVAGIRPEE